MSEQPIILVPPRSPVQEVILMPALDSPVPAESVTTVSPDQVHAREAVFSQQAQEHEQQQVMGLLGMWTGALLLHDMALDHFEGRDEEDEARPPRLKKEEEEKE